MTKEELAAQICELFDAWNAHDADAVAQFYTSGAAVRDSAEPTNAASGTAAIAARARMILSGIPDAKLEILTISVDGNRACVEWRFSGTHDGEFLGVSATGRSVDNIGASVSEFDENGKIISETDYWDVARFLRQTGVLAGAAVS
jgi:steroid delta-isomerase-like uncharacterized protein